MHRMWWWCSVVACVVAGALHTGYGSDILSSQLWKLELKDENHLGDVTYRPSLLNMPDLPSWLHYSYSRASHSGFVYGVPPEGISKLQLEVVVRDRHTYNTSRQVYSMDVVEQPRKPYELRFKVTNMNVDELLVTSRWDRLMSVMKKDIWRETSNDLTVTYLASATQKGDRLPARPDQKEGVYVGYGSSKKFSKELKQLEIEAKPLYGFHPCPTYFKKLSSERFFRDKGFAIDWCSFRLYDNSEDVLGRGNQDGGDEGHKSPVISALENEGRVYLQSRDQVMKRSYTFDVVHTILIPLVVMLVLLGLLTLAMCCHRNNIITTGQDIQMVQYASIHRATEALRALKGREHSPHPSTATTTTQADTFPRSRTASPSSTLPRNSTLSRRFEDYATLTRPDPPPYQRNGSTPTR